MYKFELSSFVNEPAEKLRACYVHIYQIFVFFINPKNVDNNFYAHKFDSTTNEIQTSWKISTPMNLNYYGLLNFSPQCYEPLIRPNNE